MTEDNDLLESAKLEKRQSLGEQWEIDVKKIKTQCFPEKKVDLAKYYIDLFYITNERDALVKAFDNIENDNQFIKTLIKLEQKKLIILKKISTFTKGNIFSFLEKTVRAKDSSQRKIEWSLQEHQVSTELFINICSLFIDQSFSMPSSKKYPYSKQKIYISRLLGVYEEITGESAECKHDRLHDIYTGKAYEFLLSSRTVLEKLNIQLGKDSTIGKYAEASLKMYREALASIALPSE